MKVGVFGGEFDPPHLGHLAVIRTARDQLGLDRLLVVPTGRPPHRSASETPAPMRLQMAELAFGREPRVEVSRVELDRDGPSYMVDTLRGLSGQGELFLIVGADQLAVFDRWHESEAVRRLATLVVAPRSPQTIAGGGIVVLDMPPVDLSSTGVRPPLAAGRAAGGLAPPVQELIDRERLYDNAPC